MKKTYIFVLIVSIFIPGLVINNICYAAGSEKTQKTTKTISIGGFSLQVPHEWKSFSSDEAASLRRQFMDQQKEIYKQFSGSDDTSKTIDVAAFHLSGTTGSFVIVILSIPPQADLIKTLKNEVDEKMEWGIREGYIRKYLGLVSVDNDKLSGFYTKAIGKDGNVQVSGGIEHKDKKNALLQLTLLCLKTWDEGKATKTLSSILESVKLDR